MSHRTIQHDAEHCPFLNRLDTRCGDRFRVDRLGDAYRYCFDQYKLCPVYLDLLIERRVRRQDEAIALNTRHAAPLVQITLPHRHAAGAADRAGVPAPSGV